MASAAEPVLIVSWTERIDPGASYAAHHRRLALLRQLLAERFARDGIACRTVLIPRSGADRSAAKPFLAGLADGDAQVVVSCEWDLDDEDLAELVRLHRSEAIRALVLTTAPMGTGLPSVVSHQAAAAAELAHHCLAAGYRRLLYLSPFSEVWSDSRGEGVAIAAKTARIPAHIEPMGDAPSQWQHIISTHEVQLRRLRVCLMRGLAVLGRGDESLTAIIACNDSTALEVRELLPGFSGGLAGFDDISSAALAELTSARQPLVALAERAAELAGRLVRGEAVPSMTEVPWELVVRRSTQRERTTSRVQQPPASNRRIDNATLAPIEPCPPVVMIGWGRVDNPGETAVVQAQRFIGSREALTASLQRDGIETATLRIDLIDDQDAVRRQMDRAVKRVVEGGARLAVVQELRLSDTAEAALAAAEARGDLRVLRMMCGPSPTDQTAVTYDQGAGGALAASHCLRQGYRRMLYLSPSSADWAIERGTSARRALLLASGGLSALLLVPEDGGRPFAEWQALDHPGRHARVAELLDEGLERLLAIDAEHSPPAVITSNDTVALELLTVLRERGLRPGTDVGVVGFDDLPRAAIEGLTSLTPPVAAMGAEAARIALRLLRGEPVPRRTCLPWALVPRASTARG